MEIKSLWLEFHNEIDKEEQRSKEGRDQRTKKKQMQINKEKEKANKKQQTQTPNKNNEPREIKNKEPTPSAPPTNPNFPNQPSARTELRQWKLPAAVATASGKGFVAKLFLFL